MPERLLDEVDRRAAVEAVAGVRMAQPMGRDLGREAGPCGRGLHDPADGVYRAGAALAGPEHGHVGPAPPAQAGEKRHVSAERSTTRVLPPLP